MKMDCKVYVTEYPVLVIDDEKLPWLDCYGHKFFYSYDVQNSKYDI